MSWISSRTLPAAGTSKGNVGRRLNGWWVDPVCREAAVGGAQHGAAQTDGAADQRVGVGQARAAHRWTLPIQDWITELYFFSIRLEGRCRLG